MTSVYTELTKEAGARGGPAALRAFYRLQGVAQGVARGRLEGFAEGVTAGLRRGRGEGFIIGAAVATVGVCGTVAYEKRRTRSAIAETAAEPTESTTGAPAPDERTDA